MFKTFARLWRRKRKNKRRRIRWLAEYLAEINGPRRYWK